MILYRKSDVMVIKKVLTMSMMMMTMSIQGTLLKPNMVTSGTKCKSQADPQEVDMDKCIWIMYICGHM